MTELALPLAQCVLTACLAGWMVSAVYNNWRFPGLNEAAVAQVMRFELMETTFPQDYAHVRHRKIENPKIIRAVFRLMVLTETAAAVLLTVGAGLLGVSLFGMVRADIAGLVALGGTLVFVLNWTAFLIGGEYFCYWYCHFGSQATHMMLAIWGTLVAGLLLMS
jgi:predicted small integral membrane protein